MVKFRLLNIFFFSVLCIAIFIEEATAEEDFVYVAPKSSVDDVEDNEKINDDTPVNILDIHLSLKPDGTSINLKNTVQGHGKSSTNDYSKGLTDSLVETPEIKSPIAARSVKNYLKKDELSTKLDYLTAQLKVLEKAAKSLQTENKVIRVDVGEETCSKYKYSLGVRYNSKTSKNQTNYPKNCKEVQENGNNVTGIYEIYPRYANAPFPVLCDMETKGGGWTYIQRRFDGSQDFFLEWKDYKFGFGNLEGEFWLGLEKIHLMTDFEQVKLLVEIVDRDNVSAYAQYNSFAIGPESGGYKLSKLSGFIGDAGDSLTAHLGEKFSTKDLDFTKDNCATLYLGGWWYKACHISNLNGKFINVDLPAKYNYKGLHWKTFRSHEYCHSKSSMLIKPVN